MWQADQDRVAALGRQVTSALAALRAEASARARPPACDPAGAAAAGARAPQASQEPRREALAALFEAVGALALLGQGGSAELAAARAGWQQLGARADASALSGLLEPLYFEQGLFALVEHTDTLRYGELPARAVALERLTELLERRDRAACLLEGAALLAGGDPPALPLDLQTSLQAFDTVLADDLWRLLPLGAVRETHAARIAPGQRDKCWWWSRGTDLGPDALDALQTTARLLHVFPSARGELARLEQAEQDLERLVRSASASPGASTPATPTFGGGPVVSLAAWIRRREALATASSLPAAGLRVAAASEERTLLERPEIALSVNDHELIIDYQEGTPLPPSGSLPPQLEAPGHPPYFSHPVFPGRFVIPLTAPALQAATGTLYVPLVDGALSLHLP